MAGSSSATPVDKPRRIDLVTQHSSMVAKKIANSSLLLYGKNILVSGAATAYAESIIMALAAEGASLILVDKEQTILKDLTIKINKKYGLSPISLALDLNYDRDEPYHNLSSSLADNEIKHIDGLITIGHYQGVPGNTLTYPTPLWKDTMQINLDGVFILVKNLLPFLLSSKNPSIIFSLLDEEQLSHSQNLASHVASHALEGFTKMLAQEMTDSHLTVCGIKFNADFYSKNQSKRTSIATEFPKILATSNKQYHNRILIIPEV